MKKSIYVACGLAVTALVAAPPSAIAQQASGTFANTAVSWYGGAGVLALSADETVYAGAGSSNEVSHLFWTSLAPMLTAGLDVRLPDGFTLAANGRVALSGDSGMEDYDWYGFDFRSYAADDWTHRSQHPKTNLDWFFDGSLQFGRDMQVRDNITVNANAGFKYTDVQWAAFGGHHIYSDGDKVDHPGDNFRTDEFDVFPYVNGITYRQQLPEFFAGLDTEIVQGDWTFGLSGKAGVTFGATATDNHWLRSLLFTDRLFMAPTVSLGASAERALTDHAKLFVAANYEKIFVARGDESVIDTKGVDSYPDSHDDVGGGLTSFAISGGLKGTF